MSKCLAQHTPSMNGSLERRASRHVRGQGRPVGRCGLKGVRPTADVVVVRPMRRTVELTAAVMISSVVAGCGASTAPHAAMTPSRPAPAITGAQASTYARTVNLQASDVRGMSVTSPEGEKPDPKRVGQIERCAGDKLAERSVANIHSATFSLSGQRQHEQIRSSVEVMPSAALAEQSNASSRSQRALACAKRFFAQEFAGHGGSHVHYGPVTVSRLPYPLPGVAGGFGYRISVAILGVPSAIEPTQPHLYVDAYVFLAGPAEVALVATAFPKPASEETVERLLSTLHSRATAHEL
jgi:hypothetical protein